MENVSLHEHLRLFARQYRKRLAGLFFLSIVASSLAYGVNFFLDQLTRSLALLMKGGGGETVPSWLAAWGTHGTLSAALLLLGVYVAVELATAYVNYIQEWQSGVLHMESARKLETAMLRNLLRKPDDFFARHPPAEILNRLQVDISRVCGRRLALASAMWCGLTIAGNLLFFMQASPPLAAIAVAGCLAGVGWTVLQTRRVKHLDAQYLRQDDDVKGCFEDVLQALPEIQTTALEPAAAARFIRSQDARSTTYVAFIRMSNRLQIGRTFAYLATFAVMIFLMIWWDRPAASVGLLPVLVVALPKLFQLGNSLVMTHLQFQLAHSSRERLLEYEGEAAPAPVGTAAGQPGPRPELHVRDVTYQYAAPGGGRLGGVEQIAFAARPGEWLAIIGGSGSGKSTLVNLILGRMAPQTGGVLFDACPARQMTGAARRARLAIMPQRPAIFDGTIRENLEFGRERPLDGEDLRVLDALGFSRLLLQRALQLRPDFARHGETLDGELRALRNSVRSGLAAAGFSWQGFGEGGLGASEWLCETLLGARGDQEAILAALRNRRSCKAMLRAAAGAAADLAELGRWVLDQQRRLLELDDYSRFAQLAGEAPPPEVWALRRQAHAQSERADLAVAVALTACTRQFPTEAVTRCRLPRVREFLTGLLGPLTPVSEDRLNPHMSWEENLVFGHAETQGENRRNELLELLGGILTQSAFGPFFVTRGLEFPVGKAGSRLSGGQRQLLALARCILRDPAVAILDEPTSALDPASRNRVCGFLRTWKANRIVLTVTHDPAVFQQADRILQLAQGRLVGDGTFEQLRQTPALQTLMRSA